MFSSGIPWCSVICVVSGSSLWQEVSFLNSFLCILFSSFFCCSPCQLPWSMCWAHSQWARDSMNWLQSWTATALCSILTTICPKSSSVRELSVPNNHKAINKVRTSPSVALKWSCMSLIGHKNVLMACEQNLQPALLGPIQMTVFLKYTINSSSSLPVCLNLKRLDGCFLYMACKFLSAEVHVACSTSFRFLLKCHFLGNVCCSPPC